VSTAHCLHIHSHGAHLVDQVGTPEQRRRILGAVVERGAMLNGTGSEPGRTARGLYNLVTGADKVDGGYVVNGKKNYASLGDAVDYNILFAQPIEMRFNEMLEGTKAQLAVKIFGNDYDALEKLAEQIKGILEKTPGVAQVECETEGRTRVAPVRLLERLGPEAADRDHEAGVARLP